MSFSPNGRHPAPLEEQIAAGRRVIRRRTGAQKYPASFQACTNTCADVAELAGLNGRALSAPDWCSRKWLLLNGITAALQRQRGQGKGQAAAGATGGTGVPVTRVQNYS